MASNQQQRRKSAGLRRLALFAFAGLLVLLFVGFAIAQGIGSPSVASGDVAVIEDAPEGLGTITEAQLRHAIVVAAAAGQVKPVPKPGDEKYDELQKAALGELFESVWIQGLGEEMGISVTPKEIAEELKKVETQQFKSKEQFQEFLEESHFTPTDVKERITTLIFNKEIQAQIQGEPTVPSSSEIEEYYEAAKSSQYTTPESRDIRTILNKDKAKVEEAKAELEKDDSVQSWEKIAKKFSTDPATKGKGGLQEGVSEGGVPEPLNSAVFAAPQGEVEEPVKDSRGYVVFEVMKITPEKLQSLEEVKSQISTQLEEQAAQQSLARIGRNFQSTWTSRTFCASEFTIERCANFKGTGRPAEADPACYEASPKKPAEACPAPVTQVKPAQPGSVTLLAPEGQRLAQRPHPAGEGAALPEGTELPPGIVPGATGE
ncbi:MAG: peptidyl-prolyl cis-trans isomerase [Solirubrobacterales bacterium]